MRIRLALAGVAAALTLTGPLLTSTVSAAVAPAQALAVSAHPQTAARPGPHGPHRRPGSETVPSRPFLARSVPLRAAEVVSSRTQTRPSGAAGSEPYVRLGGSPAEPALDKATGTLYVPIQCVNGFCTGKTAHVVDLISTAKCNVQNPSGCRVAAVAHVGNGPLAVTIDHRTHTLYVMNGTGNTVSVLSEARCNVRVTSGCARPLATVKVGKTPSSAAINDATRTLYVTSLGGGISVINTATCNAAVTKGCRARPATVPDTASPSWAAVNPKTDTVYVANAGNGSSPGSVSVIDGAACNARASAGCARKPVTVTVGVNPYNLAIDATTGTIYVPNDVNGYNAGSVSVINGNRCNRKVTAGCHTVATVRTGTGAVDLAIDPALHTVFVTNAADQTISAIDTRTCNGTVTAGCARRPRNEQASIERGPGFFSGLGAIALDPRTGTAYVENYGGLGILGIAGIGRCNATDTSGCRTEAPRAADAENLITVDPATRTIYAGDLNLPQIDVLNGATCQAGHLAGCKPVARIPMPGPGAAVGRVDDATHTLYAGSASKPGTLAVINTATCNATHTAGCAARPASVRIGAYPGVPVLNPATHTVYVDYGPTGSKVAVIDAATCRAGNTAGCKVGARVTVPASTNNLAVSIATDTVYGAVTGTGYYNGDTVWVLNGAGCDAAVTSGCGHLAATATVGEGPFGFVTDDATHTVYVMNAAEGGDAPGTVSVLDSATCNGTKTAGCRRPSPVMATGDMPVAGALDPANHRLYVSDYNNAQVSILDTARCNAEVTSGCDAAPRQQDVGSDPYGIAVDPCCGRPTVYVTQQYLPGSMSVFLG